MEVQSVNSPVSYYWTMSADASNSDNAWFMTYSGTVYYDTISFSIGARAVVEINK